MHKPKYYPNVCSELPTEYSDYENFEVKFGSQDNYEIIKKIGRGKYSEVYEGINTANNERIVIKILKPGKFEVALTPCSQENQDPPRNQDSPDAQGRHQHHQPA